MLARSSPRLLPVLLLAGCATTAPLPPIPPDAAFVPADRYRLVIAGEAAIEAVCRAAWGSEPCPIVARHPRRARGPAEPAAGEMLLAAGERAPRGGYRLRFTDVRYTPTEVVATYVVEQPGEGCTSIPMAAFPSEVVRARRSPLPVRFVREAVTYACTDGRR